MAWLSIGLIEPDIFDWKATALFSLPVEFIRLNYLPNKDISASPYFVGCSNQFLTEIYYIQRVYTNQIPLILQVPTVIPGFTAKNIVIKRAANTVAGFKIRVDQWV